MLGYPYDTKGYKSYDITTHTVFVPQNVTFFEDIFPFQHLNHADTLVVPNSISVILYLIFLLLLHLQIFLSLLITIWILLHQLHLLLFLLLVQILFLDILLELTSIFATLLLSASSIHIISSCTARLYGR